MGPMPQTSVTIAHTSFLAVVRSLRPAMLIRQRMKAIGCRKIASRISISSFIRGPREIADFVGWSSRWHANRAVEADGLAVEHRVLDDVHHQRGELVRTAQPARVGHRGAQRLPELFGKGAQQRGVEDARRDSADADK